MFECFFLTRTGLCHEKSKDNVSVTQIRILFTDLMSLACGWSSRAASASRAATTKGTSERAELACSRRCGTRAKQSTLLWKTVLRNDLLADVSASCRTGEDCASRKCNRVSQDIHQRIVHLRRSASPPGRRDAEIRVRGLQTTFNTCKQRIYTGGSCTIHG